MLQTKIVGGRKSDIVFNVDLIPGFFGVEIEVGRAI